MALSFYHKLWFSNSYNIATRFPRPLIFQAINSVRSNNLSLKYQRCPLSGCRDKEIRKWNLHRFMFFWKYFLAYFDVLRLGLGKLHPACLSRLPNLVTFLIQWDPKNYGIERRLWRNISVYLLFCKRFYHRSLILTDFSY